jgi:spore germination cell wall hydrolase CwlJ-like protein
MLSRAIFLASLAGAIVLAPSSVDAAGRPSKAAHLIGIAATHAAEADHPVMDLPPGLRRQVLCTALNVYHEARGSTRRDQIGVALVTRNRALHEQRSYCSVVWEHAQFSWTRYKVRRLIPRDDAAWSRALTRAMAVVADPSPMDMTRGARRFYNPRMVRPRWARPSKVVTARRIGQHRYVRLRDARWYK